MFNIAMKLEGLESAASIHAAGTLITKDAVLETMPMIRQDKKEMAGLQGILTSNTIDNKLI